MLADVQWQEKRKALLSAVAAQDAAEIVRSGRELLGLQRPTDVAFCATAFKKAKSALLQHGHKSLRSFFVRSVTVEPIMPALYVEAVLNGYVLDTQAGGYGSYMMELLNPQEHMGTFAPDLVCVLLDLEEVAGSLPTLCALGSELEIDAEILLASSRLEHLLQTFRAGSKARLLLQACVTPAWSSIGVVAEANNNYGLFSAVRKLNQRLKELCQKVDDCVFFDADETAGSFGRERWRDERMFLATRLPVAPAAFRLFAHALLRAASVFFRPARKVLCTDLDNTFWGGVLGEEGVSGIATGSSFPGNAFLAYQQYLKALGARGVLLAVVSKNNEEDVLEAFRLRSADLALGLDDFVARKISWNEKAQALRELAGELSLGLDSFVFVDDNPTECEAIRVQLPEVAVVQVAADEPWRTVAMLSSQWFFDTVSITKDDRVRVGEYKAQAQRAALSETSTSKEEFLASLGITCTFLGAKDAPLERFVQLLAKTNQFNLTTRRYSASEVMDFVQDSSCQAVAVRVRDRFGDAGVVGLAITKQDGDTCRIDSLLLSCRVIGRGIESAILAHIAQHATSNGARWLLGEYLETRKNEPCKSFYPDHGFTPVVDSEIAPTLYRLDLTQHTPATPSWLILEGNQADEFRSNLAVSA